MYAIIWENEMADSLLIENGLVLTLDAGGRVLERGFVLVENGWIAAISL